MAKPSDRLNATLGFAFLFASLYGVFTAVRWTIMGLIGLDEKIAAAIIAGCTTFLVSVATVVYTQQKTKAREIDNSHRPQKMEIYKRFMDKAVVGLLRSTKEKKNDSPEFQKELEELFFNFTADVIVWGSPSVVKAYTAFRTVDSDTHIIVRLDRLMQAMRKDLGNSNWGLASCDLIKLFITDPETIDPLIKDTKLTKR